MNNSKEMQLTTFPLGKLFPLTELIEITYGNKSWGKKRKEKHLYKTEKISGRKPN